MNRERGSKTGVWDRRTFLERTSGAIGGLLTLPTVSLPPFADPSLPRHWAWVHGGRERTGEEWRERFRVARRAGIGRGRDDRTGLPSLDLDPEPGR